MDEGKNNVFKKIEYTDLVLEHFRNPRNMGEIENADAIGTEGSPACGDMVSVWLKIDEKTGKIEDIKFKSYGCASNIATASMMTEVVKGKSLEEAKNISWKDITEALGGLPPVKVHCSVLAVDALKTAIRNYEEKKGILKEDKKEIKEKILDELSKVVHPELGLPLLESKMLKYVGKQDNIWLIEIGLRDEKYKNTIIDEIKEHIEEFEKEGLKFEIRFVDPNV